MQAVPVHAPPRTDPRPCTHSIKQHTETATERDKDRARDRDRDIDRDKERQRQRQRQSQTETTDRTGGYAGCARARLPRTDPKPRPFARSSFFCITLEPRIDWYNNL